MNATLIVLGSGQDGSAPQLGHTASITPPRTASSVAVISESGSTILLDASPDIRHQIGDLMQSAAYPEDRETFCDGVFITHAHMGHYAGLVHFGHESAATHATPLYGSHSLLTFLMGNEPWRSLFERGHVQGVEIGESPVRIDASLTVAALPVPHRDEFSDTVAFSVLVNGRPWLLYVPDIDAWEAWPQAHDAISSHDIALLDATFTTPDELGSRSILNIPHPLVSDTIERFRKLTSTTRIVLTHINHTNPLGRAGASITHEALSAGFEVAYDGLTMHLQAAEDDGHRREGSSRHE